MNSSHDLVSSNHYHGLVCDEEIIPSIQTSPCLLLNTYPLAKDATAATGFEGH
jgi:hypothetical protein